MNRLMVWPLGSPLGPLLANVFMTSIEENLERQGKLPSFYRRYVNVDDTLTIMPNMAAASSFLDTLNLAHSSVKFTMKLKAMVCCHFWELSY